MRMGREGMRWDGMEYDGLGDCLLLGFASAVL